MIVFKEIDFKKHIDYCLRFREDSFEISFPNCHNWKKTWDPGKYTHWIQDHAKQFPHGAVHLWKNDCLIGQLEFSYSSEIGHIFLYYLTPENRGRGYGYIAHNHAIRTMKEYGCKKATLRVSPTNIRAIRFYNSLGWKDLGKDPKYPQVNRREFTL